VVHPAARTATANNTDEVAQDVAPECRVVYVDTDPMVLAHVRALLVGGTAAELDGTLGEGQQNSMTSSPATRSPQARASSR